jgi:subtilisin family serine protease
VLAVAATDVTDRKTSFSNFGSHVFVDAPGKSVISALPNGRYGIADGTSFSAPMVSAMAALIRSLRYSGTATTIAQSTVRIDYRNPRYAGKLGYGRIDVLAGVRRR